MKNWIEKNIKLSDIKVWIILFFLIRLFGITNPPLEIAHNWRMVTTNMYARNFLEIDNNILLARVDMAGELTGITAKEFPIYNYLIYLVALVFGWQHWYGRLISLIVSSIGTYYFYLIIRKFFSEKHAFASTIVLAASVWFSYSRKIMPDSFSMSLVLAGLYYGFTYLYSGRSSRLMLYLILGTIGVLSKIPSGYVFVIFAIPFFDRSLIFKRKVWFLASSAILISVNAIWYLTWVPEVISTYKFVHYPERGFLEGTAQILDDPSGMFTRFYWNALVSFVSLGIFIGGLILAIIKKENKILLPFFLLLITFFIFVLKAGSSFIEHNYYIIPFVPALAMVSGYLMARIKWKWIYNVILIIIVIEGIANQQHEFFIHSDEKYKLELEAIADSVSNPDDLIAISGGHNPQQLYFSHRKGWPLNDEEVDDTLKVNKFRDLGARYLFINKKSSLPHYDEYPVVYEDEQYEVYDLEESRMNK